MVGINEISEEVAKKLLTSPVEVKRIIQLSMEEIVKEVKRGEMVKIVGFGSFYTKIQRPRRIREIRSGKIIEIPERRKFVFKPSPKIRFMKGMDYEAFRHCRNKRNNQ